MRLNILFLALCILLVPYISRGQSGSLLMAEQAYSAHDYQDAILHWEKISHEKRTNEILLGLAYSHARIHHPVQSVAYYEQVKESEWPFSYHYMMDYGNVLRQLEEYTKAREVFKTMESIPESLVSACDWVMQEEVDESFVELKQIPVSDVFTINGFSKKDNRVLLPVLKEAFDYEFQWMNLETGEKEAFNYERSWPYNLNSPNIVGDSLLIYSGNVSKSLFFNRKTLEAGDISQKGVNKLFIYNLDLKKSNAKPKAYAFNDPDYGCTHPFIRKDGTRLYFVSDMPGGYGGFDLYYSDKTPTGWSDPVNLGQRINSIYDEGFPFEKDGVLFFSSRGHLGYGGYDIFMTKLDSKQEVLNLKRPFNSSKDDIAYFEDNLEEGYFVSNRGNQQGKDQLWHFKRDKIEELASINKFGNLHFEQGQLIIESKDNKEEPQKLPVDLLFTKVADLQTKLAKDNIEIIGFAKNGDPRIASSLFRLPDPLAVKDKLTREESKIELSLVRPDEKEEINFKYLADYCLVTIEKTTVLTNLPLVVKEAGVRKNKDGFWIKHQKREVLLPYVYFDFDQHGLIYSSMKNLTILANFLKEFSQYSIELTGYTDTKGPEKYNLKLSERRAEVVKVFLNEQGIELERMSFLGEGIGVHIGDVSNQRMLEASQRVTLFRFVEQK